MAMNEYVPVWCRAENRCVGGITFDPGALLHSGIFLWSFEPAPGYDFDDSSVRDGVRLLCPRCQNPLIIFDGTEDIVIVPGALRFGGEPLDDTQLC